MKMPRDADLIAQACDLIASEHVNTARTLLTEKWPFAPYAKALRKRTRRQLMAIWIRDGFIDRYGGERLVYPGVLRLLGKLLPKELPYHPNGKLDRCHVAHWMLYPSHDHVVPVARGGSDDDDENIVTTSMLRNQIKAQWTLDEIGWKLLPPGDVSEWDGLSGWYTRYIDSHPEIARADRSLRDWYTVAITFER